MVTLYRIAGRFHAFLMPAPQSLERFLYRHAWPRILERLLDLLAHVSCELRRLGLVFLEQAQGVLDDGVGGGIGARLDRVADRAHDRGRQGHADRLGIHGSHPLAKNLRPRTRTERAGFLPPPTDPGAAAPAAVEERPQLLQGRPWPPSSPNRSVPPSRSRARPKPSRSAASIASGATTRRMRARWAGIRPASRRSSS